MTWRLALSLKTLRAQVDAKWPGRSKASDGSIADAAHSARKSDHNPDASGRVNAIDITHDPANGLDAGALAEILRNSGDPRLKYIISNARIASADKGWAWRPYTGLNAHRHHVHVSVVSGPIGDGEQQWDLDGIAPGQPLLKRGDRGAAVRHLQMRLNRMGWLVTVDGDFGARTAAAVEHFQLVRHLTVDGVVGAETWAALT